MKATKILTPVDFSDYSRAALSHATLLARGAGAELLIVHVKDPPRYQYPDRGCGAIPIEEDDSSLIDALHKVVPDDSGIAYSHKLVTGNPANEIVKLADKEHADLIVMGTHGRTGLTRVLMGSVAEAVVRRANCPVLTVRQPDAASEAANAGSDSQRMTSMGN